MCLNSFPTTFSVAQIFSILCDMIIMYIIKTNVSVRNPNVILTAATTDDEISLLLQFFQTPKYHEFSILTPSNWGRKIFSNVT